MPNQKLDTTGRRSVATTPNKNCEAVATSKASVAGGDQLSLGISIDGQDVGAERRTLQREAEETRDWVREARRVAAQIALAQGIITSDDVHKVCPKPDHAHDNTWGAILGKPYFFRGSEVYSKRRSANKRSIHRWHMTQKGRELL